MTQPDQMTRHTEILLSLAARAPVIPVLVVDAVENARPLARALAAGGLTVPEVTLRTDAALDVIREMAQEEGVAVGAGTLLSDADIRAAKEAGAHFGVSPGATQRLLDAARDHDLPLLPGAASASEAMWLAEQGVTFQKFFPAEAAGGAALLKSLASPLPAIRFCPTGGVGIGNVNAYLGLDNVACVGGSWVAPAQKVAAGDWAGITALARAAAGLR